MYSYTLAVNHNGVALPLITGNELPALRERARRVLSVTKSNDIITITDNRTGVTEYLGKDI